MAPLRKEEELGHIHISIYVMDVMRTLI
jgi:hypothetical protein